MTDAPAPESRLVLLGTGGADADERRVGAKAANLMRLIDAGIPVPPGFVLTTDVCAQYRRTDGSLGPGVGELVAAGVAAIERESGRSFGAARRPLLLAVRSGAPVSMPGMLDTVLDVGLCDASAAALVRATGDPAFVWDSYRRFVMSYAETVGGCPAAAMGDAVAAALERDQVPDTSELDVSAHRALVRRLQELYRAQTGGPFPQSPRAQLTAAVEAVLRSWDSARAVEYRRLAGLTGLPGTAVTVQAMVYGNLGARSGAGVAFTRDPSTGENRLYADFLLEAQGEDVVAGRHAAADSERMIAAVPGLRSELERVRATLEAVFRDIQDFEFTVEEGTLWVLQTRAAKRTPLAALQIACDLVAEGLIDTTTALERLRGLDLDRISRTRLDDPRAQPIAHATGAGGGIATGRVALDAAEATRLASHGDDVILVRAHASTDDVAALAVCRAVLAATGARTSHAAVVARQLGIACLVNCPSLTIDLAARSLRIGGRALGEHDVITVDGGTGAIYLGALPLADDRPDELIATVRAWRSAAA